MGCNGIEHLCKQVLEEKKGFRQMNDDELVSVREEVMSQEVDDSVSSKMKEDSKANFGHQSSESEATSLPHIGLCSFALSILVYSFMILGNWWLWNTMYRRVCDV